MVLLISGVVLASIGYHYGGGTNNFLTGYGFAIAMFGVLGLVVVALGSDEEEGE